jgi:hypothetical protein
MSINERNIVIKNKIEQLLAKLPEESSTRKQLENHLELHGVSCNYLTQKEHRLAFIGNVGAGKTTSICHLLNLLDGKTPVLSTGSGRTTLCEVEIKYGEQLSISVQPCSDIEVKSYLADFSLYLKASSQDSRPSNEDTFKLSAEVERALRNMLDLKVSRSKDSEGKRLTIDAAKNLADSFNTSIELLNELEDRIQLINRMQTHFEPTSAIDNNNWLHETFKTINSGTHPKVGLAKKITLTIPDFSLNFKGFSITVVDTKGVDQTVNRLDLDKCLTSERTVSVLCSRFNDAPDKTTVSMVENSLKAGLKNRISSETMILVLDREGEAEDVIDVDEAVGDKDEGREIREEQITNDVSQRLQVNDLSVLFFDAKRDGTENLLSTFVDKIKMLRKTHESHLQDIEIAVSEIEIELTSQSAKQAKKQVLQTLEPWLKKSHLCSPSLGEYFVPLISDISDKTTYAASIRASVNREGDWHNFDYYQILASAARSQCVDVIRPLQDNLLVLLDNMLSQNELQPAYSLLKQLKNTTNTRLDELYQMALARGRSTYETKLKADSSFWNDLYSEWGAGPGYKKRISTQSHNWFLHSNYSLLENKASQEVSASWKRFVDEIESLIGAVYQ